MFRKHDPTAPIKLIGGRGIPDALDRWLRAEAGPPDACLVVILNSGASMQGVVHSYVSPIFILLNPSLEPMYVNKNDVAAFATVHQPKGASEVLPG